MAIAALLLVFVTALPVFAANRTGGTLADGAPAATVYYVQDTGIAGPTVVIVGGVHGNEPAGAAAAEQVRGWPIVKGRIVVLPRANVLGLKANVRYIPQADEAVRDLNRDFRKAEEEGPPRGELATAIWELVERQKPDWLIDLHEGIDFNQINPKSVGSSVIVFPTAEGRKAAREMLDAVNATIADEQKHFVERGPPVDGSLARAAGVHLKAHAMILETTSKEQPLSKRARQHRVMVHCFLKHLGMLDPAVDVTWMTDRNDPRRKIALYDAGGSTGKGVPRIVELLGDAPDCTVVRVGPQDIAAGALDQFRLVIFTGGSGSAQAKALGDAGREQVKRFVDNGGGYIGICAGAYLACDGFSWGLKVLDAKTVSPKWQRGRGNVEIELTGKGREIFGEFKPRLNVLYANGPILAPAASDLLDDYEPLAHFRTELAENGSPMGVMVNSPAMVAGRSGKGRVLCISPHSEQTEGLENIVRCAVD